MTSDRHVQLDPADEAAVLDMIDQLYGMLRTLNGLPGSYPKGWRPQGDTYENPFYWVERSVLSLLTALLDSQDAADAVFRMLMDDVVVRAAIRYFREDEAAEAASVAEAVAEDAAFRAAQPEKSAPKTVNAKEQS